MSNQILIVSTHDTNSPSSSIHYLLIELTGDDIISQLSEKLDPSVLETTIGGDDARPFNSSKYLQGEFHRDFTAILNDP